MTNLQVLPLAKIKFLIFSSAFTALAILTPIVFHQFGGVAAGKVFLPMHIFVLAAGLVLGWRAGLVVGLATPIVSFSLTGMPVSALLPFIVLELASYGFFAGILREIFKQKIWVSLLGAMVFGRAALWLAILILPNKLAASQYLLGIIKTGWPGILLQLAIIPLLAKVIHSFLSDERI